MSVRKLVFAAVAASLLFPLVPGVPTFWITLCNYIGLFSLVAVGLVLLTGVGGMTSFGQAAFVGFGAYTTAVLTLYYGFSPWLTVFASLAVTGLLALLLGLVTVRLSGHYLPLGTLAWGIAIFFLLGNTTYLGRYDGLFGIPPLTIAGVPLTGSREAYFVIWVCLAGAMLLTLNLLNSRAGRAIRALREGTQAAESCGVNTVRAKLVVFVYAALLAALSGWLYAHIQRAISPGTFSIGAGIEYLLMAVIGGVGHVAGAVLGAALVTVLEDILQDVLPALLGSTGPYEIIVFGILLVVILQTAPTGLSPLLARLLPARRDPPPPAPAPALPQRPKPARRTPLLELQSLRKAFGGLVAVNDVSFSVNSGEVVGLIGPNGAGKSTTFNMITGVIRPSAGEIRFLGERIDHLPARAIAARGIGRTFQHVKLMPDMTVLDNVALGAHLRGQCGMLRGMLRLNREEERRLRYEAARQLERVGLADVMYRPAGSLALGQARLVEIARALCLDPVLLLLDEPAAGLRYQEKQKLAELLQALQAEGISILLVEHDMQFVMGLADRLVVLDFGVKIAEGGRQEVRRNAAVQEAYLGGVL